MIWHIALLHYVSLSSNFHEISSALSIHHFIKDLIILFIFLFILFFHVINLNNPTQCLLLEVSNKVPSPRRLFGFCTTLLFDFLYRSNTVSSSRTRFTSYHIFLQAVCTSFVLCTNIVVLLYRRNDMTFAILKFRLRHYRLVSLLSTFPLSWTHKKPACICSFTLFPHYCFN